MTRELSNGPRSALALAALLALAPACGDDDDRAPVALGNPRPAPSSSVPSPSTPPASDPTPPCVRPIEPIFRQPWTIAEGSPYSFHTAGNSMAVRGDYAYSGATVNDVVGLYRIPLAGGTPEPVVADLYAGNATPGLVVYVEAEGTSLLYATHEQGSQVVLRRTELGAGAPSEPLATVDAPGDSVAVVRGGGYLFVRSTRGDVVWRMPTAGGVPEPAFQLPADRVPDILPALYAGADFVAATWLAEPGGVQQVAVVPVDGSAPRSLAMPEGRPLFGAAGADLFSLEENAAKKPDDPDPAAQLFFRTPARQEGPYSAVRGAIATLVTTNLSGARPDADGSLLVVGSRYPQGPRASAARLDLVRIRGDGSQLLACTQAVQNGDLQTTGTIENLRSLSVGDRGFVLETELIEIATKVFDERVYFVPR